jgi:putative ATPase
MPEGRLVLAHVTLYLSLQPKSNSSYEALEKALEHVKKSETLDVPPHLRSAHPGSKDYKYPHDYKYHFVSQDYTGKRVHFFEPGELGAERELKKRLDFFKQLREKKED